LTFAWGSAQPNIGVQGTIQTVLTAEQIQRRVLDIARQINTDYAGKMLYAVGVLEDGFVFMADLVRQLELPVVCQFVKPETKEVQQGDVSTTQMLIQGLLQSGIVTEFLMRNLTARGAASVKVATLLDRQTGRRVMLQPDYFGFLVDESFVFGYGMGTRGMGRNLPYVATTKETAGRSAGK